jgi:DNA polymerase-3 subunit delta'
MAEAAANALLKTLEEPPEHTGFILVTEHAADLLPTIISRCQRVRFGAVQTRSLVDWLASQGIADTQTLASLSLGCPGVALALAQGDLEKRRALRDDLISTVAQPAEHLFKWSQKLTTGPRERWRPKVDLVLDLLEEILRDVVMLQANEKAELIHADIHTIIDAFRVRLYPEGVTAIAQTITDARRMLRQYVNGRLVVDTILSRIQVELGDPPR